MNSRPGARAVTPPDLLRAPERQQILHKVSTRVPQGDGPGCFLCKWIFEDLTKNGKLTDEPKEHSGAGMFPILSKTRHLELEGFLLDVHALPAV